MTVNTDTPMTDALTQAITDRGAYPPNSCYGADDFAALARRLERDRAALIAALERIERLTSCTGGAGRLLLDHQDTARMALAQVRS